MYPHFQSELAMQTEYGEENYFAPSRCFRNGLINQKLIENLRQPGVTMLSIGAGRGYLERLIVHEFGISPSQIEVADLRGHNLPKGLSGHTFDMTTDWPDLGKRYDLIIFVDSFFHLDKLNEYNANGELRIGGAYKLEVILQIFKKSIVNLMSGGEIRIAPHFLETEELEYLKKQLQIRNPEIEMQWDKWLISIKLNDSNNNIAIKARGKLRHITD